jgi:hypothetical protein
MINNKKLRPQNAPGSNGLRGGVNLYSTKTAVGRWQDDIGGPAGYKRGFTTVAFETEAQHQQLGVIQKRSPFYGAMLPTKEQLDLPASPLSGSNKLDRKDQFLTNTQMHNESIFEKVTSPDLILNCPTKTLSEFETLILMLILNKFQ